MTYDEVRKMNLNAVVRQADLLFAYVPGVGVTLRCGCCGHERKLIPGDKMPLEGWRHRNDCACAVCKPVEKTTVISMSGWLTSHGRAAR